MKVRLTSPDAKAPLRANPTDAGADLFSTMDVVITRDSEVMIDLGVQIELPKNTVGLVFARSSLGSMGIRPRNAVGVIDEKYRGNLKIMLENSSSDHYEVRKGDRIAQLVIVPVYTPELIVVDELDADGDRGGGFGSTGK